MIKRGKIKTEELEERGYHIVNESMAINRKTRRSIFKCDRCGNWVPMTWGIGESMCSRCMEGRTKCPV